MSSPSPQDHLESLLVAHATSGVGETLLTVADVARVLHVDASWVYERAAELGALRLGVGARAPIRFEPRTLAERLTALQPAPASTPSAPPRTPARRTGKPNGLLPVRARVVTSRGR